MHIACSHTKFATFEALNRACKHAEATWDARYKHLRPSSSCMLERSLAFERAAVLRVLSLFVIITEPASVILLTRGQITTPSFLTSAFTFSTTNSVTATSAQYYLTP